MASEPGRSRISLWRPDYGDLAAVAKTVGGGDSSAYYAAWTAAGDRTIAAGELADRAGHRQSAQELFLRSSAFYAASYHSIYGAPVDPRLLEAFRLQRQALDRGLALNDPPVMPQAIPFEDRCDAGLFSASRGFCRRETTDDHLHQRL